MKRKIMISCIVFILCTLTIKFVYADDAKYTNESTNYKVIIEDDANLLTDIEENALLDEMKPLTEYGNIIFKSINRNTSNSTKKYAENYYYNNFGNNNGTMFLIDMYKREIYICSGGANYKKVRKSKAEAITDNIYKMATRKEYYKCSKEAYNQIYKVLNNEKIAEPMKYICNALIAIIMSEFIIFFIIIKILNPKKAKNKEIIESTENWFEASKPKVDLIHTSKIYSPVEHSSGGGSFGGGGGHSGGRRI